MPMAPKHAGVMVERVLRCTHCSRPLSPVAHAYLLSISLRPQPVSKLLTDMPPRDFHDFFLGVPNQGVFCSTGCVHSWVAFHLAAKPLVELAEQEVFRVEHEG